MAETMAAPAGAGHPEPHDDHGAHGHLTNTGISNEKLGMWLFLGSECLLFGGLISTFLLYKKKLNTFQVLEQPRFHASLSMVGS